MDILRGFTAPWLAGLVRAILLAIVGAIIAWLGTNADLLPAAAQWAVPVIVLVLRQIEALFDQQRVSGGQVIAPTPAVAPAVADVDEAPVLNTRGPDDGAALG